MEVACEKERKERKSTSSSVSHESQILFAIDSAELLRERNTEGLSQEEQKKQQSFTAALTTTIVDNVQIQVKNVHIRYEDALSDPGHPFAAGLTLRCESFCLSSTALAAYPSWPSIAVETAQCVAFPWLL